MKTPGDISDTSKYEVEAAIGWLSYTILYKKAKKISEKAHVDKTWKYFRYKQEDFLNSNMWFRKSWWRLNFSEEKKHEKYMTKNPVMFEVSLTKKKQYNCSWVWWTRQYFDQSKEKTFFLNVNENGEFIPVPASLLLQTQTRRWNYQH